MTTLSLSVSERQISKFGLSNVSVSLDDLIKKLKKEFAKQALWKCRDIARKTGLSTMTMEEIDDCSKPPSSWQASSDAFDFSTLLFFKKFPFGKSENLFPGILKGEIGF